jgi:hypothetical protein
MTAANFTLTTANGASDQSRAMFLVLGGTPGASFAVIVPSVSKLYFVTNNTGFAQTVRTSGTGISVPNGASMTLRCDGTNVVVAQNYFASMTLGSALPVASGGTGATTSTGTGAVVLATRPTRVTPALGTPASGNFSSGSFTWPTFNQNTTGTASNVTGIVAVANGGTGQTTQQAAINSLAGATTSGQFLRGNGTNVVMSAIQVTDVPTLNQNTTGTAAGLSATLAVSSGGTGAATFTANNVLLGNGTSAFQSVAPGANGNVLTSNGTTWTSSAPASSVIPSGTIMLFVQTSAPTGWTKSTTHDNKALRVVSGTVSSGGSVAFTTAFASQSVSGTVGDTAISIAQMPAHSHGGTTSSAGAHQHTQRTTSVNTGGGLTNIPNATDTGATNTDAGVTDSQGNHSHTITSEGSGNTHTHSFTGTAINLAVQYVDVIIATKN